jgi:hypothetical protein
LSAPNIGTRYLIISNIGGGIRETLIADSRSNRIDTSIDFTNVDAINVFVNGTSVGFNTVNVQGTLSIRLSTPVNVDDIITYEVFLNESGPNAWKNADDSDFIANTNDVIEWSGTKWSVIFNAAATTDTITYLTNIYTNVQYKWDGVSWRKSFEGEYPRGTWRLEL